MFDKPFNKLHCISCSSALTSGTMAENAEIEVTGVTKFPAVAFNKAGRDGGKIAEVVMVEAELDVAIEFAGYGLAQEYRVDRKEVSLVNGASNFLLPVMLLKNGGTPSAVKRGDDGIIWHGGMRDTDSFGIKGGQRGMSNIQQRDLSNIRPIFMSEIYLHHRIFAVSLATNQIIIGRIFVKVWFEMRNVDRKTYERLAADYLVESNR